MSTIFGLNEGWGSKYFLLYLVNGHSQDGSKVILASVAIPRQYESGWVIEDWGFDL